jgi:hypothetical protein
MDRSEVQRLHQAAKRAWQPSDLPDWLNEMTCREKIQPRFGELTVPAKSTALGISGPYATEVRTGKRCPHPQHWEKLARLIDLASRKTKIQQRV